MKNTFRFTTPTIAAMAVIALTVLSVSAAGPSAAPTGGSVDATFSTVSGGTGAASPAGIGGDFSGSTSGVRGTVTGGLMNTYGVQGVGSGIAAGVYGSNSAGGNGVLGVSATGTGGQFTGTTYGVSATASGGASTGGKFTGGLYGVEGAGMVGVNGTSSSNGGAGVQGTVTGNMGIGIYGHVSGAGATTGKAIVGQVEASAPASAKAGIFINQLSGKGVELGGNTDAIFTDGPVNFKDIIYNSAGTDPVTVQDAQGLRILGANPTAQAFSVSGDASGGYAMMRSDGTYYADIATAPNTFKEAFRVTGGSWGANPDGTLRIMNDGELMINLNAGAGVNRMAAQIDGNPAGTGLHIYNDGSISQDTISSGVAAGLSIARNGDISNQSTTPFPPRPPLDNPVKIADGLNVTGSVSAAGFAGSSASIADIDAVSSLRVSHIWPGGFDADTRFENGGIIVSNNGAGGGPTNASITKAGHMTAVGGFGRIYTTSGSGVSVPANTYASIGSASCSNTTTDRVLSCSFSTSSNVYMADSYPSSTSCLIYVRNTDSIAHTVTPKVTCMDPNGSW